MKRSFHIILPILLFVSLILSACDIKADDASLTSVYTPLRESVSSCDYGGEIKSVEAVDEYTVRFTLCTPDAAFPSKMASPIFAIQDDQFLKLYHGDSELMSETMNTTGSFRVISNIKVGDLELYYSNSYWGITPAIDYLVFKFSTYPGDDPSFYELSNSDIYSAFRMNKDLVSSTDSSGLFSKKTHTALNLVYLGFNNKVTPMDNQAVRKAIAGLVDRSKLVDSYFPDGASVASQIVPLGVAGHSDDLDWSVVDTAQVHTQLEKANFDFNQELTLAYVNVSSDLISSPDSMVKEIKKEFEKAGLKLVLKPMTQEEFGTALAGGSEMMFLDSFKAAYADGAAFYEMPFLRQASAFGNSYPEILDGLKQAQSQTDYNLRQAKFDELNKLANEQAALIPIGNVPEWSYFRTNLSNTAVNGYFEDLENLTNHSTRVEILQLERPQSLWPADETNYDTFRITRLLYDTLTSYDFVLDELKSDIAESWQSNSDATEWTFTLRYGVKFTNGSTLDANDVVASFAAIWNSSDASHKGRTGEFTLFKELFGPLATIQ